MKIKNDLISIKIGKKQYDFHNLILDEYLKIFASAQLNENEVNLWENNKELNYLLIKFDVPLENVNGETVLKNENFDIVLLFSCFSKTQDITEKKIISQYLYRATEDSIIRDYSEGDSGQHHPIQEYFGRKITALGFNTYWTTSSFINNPVKAYLDTSNYNIYIQENQEFTVTRRDIITTDSLFYSNNVNKVSGPLHLTPMPNKAVIEPNWLYNESGAGIGGTDESYGIIYSIGLSSYIDRIDKEFIIGQDVEITQNGTELSIEGIENYLSNEKLLYPNFNLYPSSSLYPIKTNYKYIIIKYKVWQNILSGTYENPVYTMTDTGYFYYQAVPINKFGKLNLEIKYERG